METKRKRPLLSFDWAVRKILRDPAHYDIWEGFLASLLRQDIRILSILENQSHPERPTDDRFNKVDLVVENAQGEILVVAVQNNREVHYYEHLLNGVWKLKINPIHLGENLERVAKAVSISILYSRLEEGNDDYVYHGRAALYGVHDGRRLELSHQKPEALLGRRLEIAGDVVPEYYLIALERFPNVIKSDLDEWIYFFKNSTIAENFKAKNIRHLEEKFDLYNMSEREYKAYERYLRNTADAREALETARMEGMLKGFQETRPAKEVGDGKTATARMMLADQKPLEEIKRYTNLSEEEILQLKSRL